VLRRLKFDAASLPKKVMLIFALSYTTAILETWSISAYPHYWYPSLQVMLTVGSAFYSLFFLVTYPMFQAFWGNNNPTPLQSTCFNALASCTLIYFAYETWTAVVGESAYV
jgi:cycloeucalenol cycloisomerase